MLEESMMPKFYITTSLPYVNASPHIGFALELIQADVIARSHRAKGEDVLFLTGADEHGIKVAKSAATAGKAPQEYADEYAAKFQQLGKELAISTDDFIRTTDKQRHWPATQEVWQRLEKANDLEKRLYKGRYCIGHESFHPESEIVGNECPSYPGRQLELVEEENWFFKLSKYSAQLKACIEKDTIRIIPESRKNEVLQLIEQGLQDVSFSRPKEKLSWGVSVPGDESQVMYVWADALTNYISAIGYPNGERFGRYWPADVHVVGKDILRFHALIWPAMLLSIGEQLPKSIFVHGFITVEGQKMSKSIGNVIDPFELIQKYGVDAVRYHFLREIPATQDGDFSYEKFESRYNSDLAAGLGNLVARTLTLAKKYIPEAAIPEQIEQEELKTIVAKARERCDGALSQYNFAEALESIWEIVHACDKYIDRERPWEEPQHKTAVLLNLLRVLWVISEHIEPFLPETAERIRQQLKTKESEPLFPRLN